MSPTSKSKCPSSSDDNSASLNLGECDDKRIGAGSIGSSVEQSWMYRKDSRYGFLDPIVQLNEEIASGNCPSEDFVIFSFEFDSDFICSSQGSACNQSIYIGP
jgi:hypothetical protein